jgi:UDP-N-acetyl-D-glucosamine dehydrogenase
MTVTSNGANGYSPIWTELVEKFEGRDATLGVVGLGYVGLPVAITFAEAGFRVIGVDTSKSRIDPLQEGKSYLRDISDERIAKVCDTGRFRATTSYRGLAKADAVIICVPTPLSEGIPDVSSIAASGRALSKVLKQKSLVILESTTYPGTTEDLLKPLLETSGMQAGVDFLLAFSPERIDPGNPNYGFEDIPKVVGGITSESTLAAHRLYSQVVPKVVTVSGTREAEMAKLIENTFRHVNIGLVNELAIYAQEWGVDIWEAIEAAASKPFGYMPFWPGPGWGGHCIPLDPSYLSWRVRQEHSHEIRFVELAHKVNAEMPRHVVERVALLLNERGKALRNSKILALGVAYKGGTEDTRGSPAIKVLNMLEGRGADISYHDPLVSEVSVGGRTLTSVPLKADLLRGQDLVVSLTPQDEIDWRRVYRDAPFIFDCCNAFGTSDEKVVRL